MNSLCVSYANLAKVPHDSPTMRRSCGRSYDFSAGLALSSLQDSSFPKWDSYRKLEKWSRVPWTCMSVNHMGQTMDVVSDILRAVKGGHSLNKDE